MPPPHPHSLWCWGRLFPKHSAAAAQSRERQAGSELRGLPAGWIPVTGDLLIVLLLGTLSKASK